MTSPKSELTPERKATILLMLRADKRRADSEQAVFRSSLRAARASGLTTREIGAAIGCTASTVVRWSREAA